MTDKPTADSRKTTDVVPTTDGTTISERADQSPAPQSIEWWLIVAGTTILGAGFLRYCTTHLDNAAQALSTPVVSIGFGLILLGYYRKQIGERLSKITEISKERVIFDKPEPTAAGTVDKVAGQGHATAAARIVEQKLLPEAVAAAPENGILTEKGWLALYEKTRNVFLAHQIKPSVVPGMKYDVYIYLVGEPAGPNDLDKVERARFYLGPDWGNAPFVCRSDGTSRIGIQTTAYGPVICSCVVDFKDSENGKLRTVELTRWIDFEMEWVFADKE